MIDFSRFAVRDKTLHLVLYAAVVILVGTTVYFRFFWQPADPFNEVFLSQISQFDRERQLQEQAEMVKPGSVDVPILIYHSVRPHSANESPLQKEYDVAPESFIQQMQYLEDHGYSVIGLDFLATALTQNISLPKKSVAITLDDGWRSQYAWAFPILRKHHYTATFFVYTDPIGAPYFMTWDQIRVLSNSGMTIGGHTVSHAYLVNISDPDQLRHEVGDSKRIIEDQIGKKIDLFAYPYGHYNDQIVQIVREAGYQAARSTYGGTHHTRDELFILKGLIITDDFNKFVEGLNS